MRGETRGLTIRYASALLVVGALLVAGQFVIQRALDAQQHDAHRINLAGRQRMLSQRLCMLMVAERPTYDVAIAWATSQIALRASDNPPRIDQLFDQIQPDHRAMLEAARTHAPAIALAHEDTFLAGMDAIVTAYEADARDRVIRLRRIELALLALALIVLALEGVYVLRPAVRAIALRRAAEHAVRDAGELERKRIAQDLHDGLGQQLVGISFLASAMPASPERDELTTLLSEAIDQTRQLSRGLHSHALEAGGLAAALRELAAQTERVFKIACSVEVDALLGNRQLAEPMRTHLYRIAGEAVANASKHARATHIAIRVTSDAGSIVLEVRDDGVGIGTPNADGLGLQLMAHRASVLGGDLQVTRVGTGTVVTCRVPR